MKLWRMASVALLLTAFAWHVGAQPARNEVNALGPGGVASLQFIGIAYIAGDAEVSPAYTAEYVALFEEFGATVTVIPQEAAGTTDYGGYDVVVIGHDTVGTPATRW